MNEESLFLDISERSLVNTKDQDGDRMIEDIFESEVLEEELEHTNFEISLHTMQYQDLYLFVLED
jgi:hypothetical protein